MITENEIIKNAQIADIKLYIEDQLGNLEWHGFERDYVNYYDIMDLFLRVLNKKLELFAFNRQYELILNNSYKEIERLEKEYRS